MNADKWQEDLRKLAQEVHHALGAWRSREQVRSEDPSENCVEGIERRAHAVYRTGVDERERLRRTLRKIEACSPSLRANWDYQMRQIDSDLVALRAALGLPVLDLPEW